MISDILRPGEAVDFAAHLLDPVISMSTGLPSLDEVCVGTGGKGLAAGWYVVLGGASNSGKTKMALNLYQRAALQGWTPGIITMEVPKRGLQRTIYSNITSFGYYDMLPDRWLSYTGETADAKSRRLMEELRQYSLQDVERGMYVAEFQRAPTLADIMSACTALKESGCKVIFLDHLQLIKASAENIADRATDISEELRWFAHGEGILVIALSQLNRMASRDRDRRPTMHDLYGGTSVESNANMCLLIDSSRQLRDPEHPWILRTFLLCDKNREGPNRLDIPVLADFKTGLWSEAEEEELGMWPGMGDG